MWRRLGVVLSIVLLPSIGRAQARPSSERSIVVSLGVVRTTQSGHHAAGPYEPVPPLEGTTVGVIANASRGVTSRLSVGGEVSVGGILRGQQQFRAGSLKFVGETTNRDTLFTGFVTVSIPNNESRVSLYVVAGGGVAVRSLRRAGVLRDPTIPSPVLRPDEDKTQAITRQVPVLTGGVDVAWRLTKRFGLVPFVRVDAIPADTSIRDPGTFIGGGMLRMGVAAQGRF